MTAQPEQSAPPEIWINYQGGQHRMLADPDDLTFGEIEDLELAGYSFSAMKEAAQDGRVMLAMVWTTLRRIDPAVTLEQLRKTMKPSDTQARPAPKAPADRRPRKATASAASGRGSRGRSSASPSPAGAA